jgi:hypothetical protein
MPLLSDYQQHQILHVDLNFCVNMAVKTMIFECQYLCIVFFSYWKRNVQQQTMVMVGRKDFEPRKPSITRSVDGQAAIWWTPETPIQDPTLA